MMAPPKIFYCTLFFNEFEILEILLNELNHFVDYFVLLEADHSFSGIKKNFMFEKNKQYYSQFLSKILYIKLENCSITETSFTWLNQHEQRNYLSKVLDVYAQNKDLVVLADVDEIPRISTFRRAIFDAGRSRKAQCLEIEHRMYKFDLRTQNLKTIFGPAITCRDQIENMQKFRENRNNYSLHKNGGWHFHSLGNVKQLKEKCTAVSALEYAQVSLLPEKEIENKINERKELLDRDSCETVELKEENFPKYVWENRSEFQEFFKQKV